MGGGWLQRALFANCRAVLVRDATVDANGPNDECTAWARRRGDLREHGEHGKIYNKDFTKTTFFKLEKYFKNKM